MRTEIGRQEQERTRTADQQYDPRYIQGPTGPADPYEGCGTEYNESDIYDWEPNCVVVLTLKPKVEVLTKLPSVKWGRSGVRSIVSTKCQANSQAASPRASSLTFQFCDRREC